MYYIYWMVDRKNKRTYVGYTDNLKRRMKEHRSGLTKSTKNFNDFEIHVLETVDDRQMAREREKYWKSGLGRRKLKILY